jgi:hypothetical protein
MTRFRISKRGYAISALACLAGCVTSAVVIYHIEAQRYAARVAQAQANPNWPKDTPVCRYDCGEPLFPIWLSHVSTILLCAAVILGIAAILKKSK